jgi:hypothetical protein
MRLTIDDITQDADGQVFVRFGQPPTPVPEPFAALRQLAQLDPRVRNHTTVHLGTPTFASAAGRTTSASQPR